MKNINKMSVIELQELEVSIKRCIIDKNKDTTFWEEIKIQSDLIHKQRNIDVQINELIESSNKLKLIKDIGYSIVFYSDDKLGLLNYSKSELKDKYYGFDYSLEDGITKRYDDVTDEDLEQIKVILEIE